MKICRRKYKLNYYYASVHFGHYCLVSKLDFVAVPRTGMNSGFLVILSKVYLSKVIKIDII